MKTPSKAAVMKRGEGLGLKRPFLQEIIETFGPYIAQILIGVLAKDKAQLKAGQKLKTINGKAALAWLKNVVVKILTDYRDQVLVWVDEGEGVVYDAIVAIVASHSVLLAGVLTAYKQEVIHADDQVAVDILDKAIALLQDQ